MYFIHRISFENVLLLENLMHFGGFCSMEEQVHKNQFSNDFKNNAFILPDFSKEVYFLKNSGRSSFGRTSTYFLSTKYLIIFYNRSIIPSLLPRK